MGILRKNVIIIIAASLLLLSVNLYAQEFGLGLGIGAEVIEGTSYQTVRLSPDIAFGKIGIGLDAKVRFNFEGEDSSLEIYEDDWIVDDGEFMDWVSLYLSKFNYIRYGIKGEPLYAKFGTVSDATLGNGFIMGYYSNGMFKPEQSLFGMNLDVDGKLFNFPYVGMEAFVNNVASFDVMGTRVYTRPLAGTTIPIAKDLEIGVTAAMDRDPMYYLNDAETALVEGIESSLGEDSESIMIYGFDLTNPILSTDMISLAAFADIAFQPNGYGSQLGVGGRLIQIVTYGAQLRILGDNFVPTYFNQSYDMERAVKAIQVQTDGYSEGSIGYSTSLGISVMEDALAFNASVDGPFAATPDAEDETKSDTAFPHLRMTFNMAEDLLSFGYITAYYDKSRIDSFESLVDPENANIGATVNYKSGSAVISLIVDVKYDPLIQDDEKWVTTTKLETSISLF